MAVREFTDSRGVEWRVWDVTPAHMHPVTRGEDYMADLQDGWLAFESGREKRRLEMENEILRRAAAYFAKDALPK